MKMSYPINNLSGREEQMNEVLSDIRKLDL